MKIAFDNSLYRELPGYYLPSLPERAPAPHLLYWNAALAGHLGLDPGSSDEQALAEMFGGWALPDGADPIGLAYSGHQFGHFSAQLGDGRALLLGEIISPDGRRHDIQLKGSGRTHFSRGGDGKAGLGPILREYLISEAMAALGVPTTRVLAVIATGETVMRDRALPGALLVRTAASHLRVGTVQFFATHAGVGEVRLLADYIIKRHFPAVATAANPYLALLDAIIDGQAHLVARWMQLGFVHGVLNTDNVTVSGETIDYGPCAFLDRYDPLTCFSSIDKNGRYAYGNQPKITQWNMARLADALIPAIASVDAADVDRAQALIGGFADRYYPIAVMGMGAKLGLAVPQPGDGDLVADLFAAMAEERADFTSWFRDLGRAARGEAILGQALTDPMRAWLVRWHSRILAEGGPSAARGAAMDRVNPAVIPRNHLVEAALVAAVDENDFGPFDSLLAEVRDPWRERASGDPFAAPPSKPTEPYVTFCGT